MIHLDVCISLSISCSHSFFFIPFYNFSFKTAYFLVRQPLIWPPQDTYKLAVKSITMQGLNLFDYLSETAACRADLMKWVQEGRLRRAETVVKGGLENAPAALADLLAGKNVGKMVLEVKAP